MPRRSATQIADSRADTLAAAVQVASVVGLDGLSLGALAAELGMSKSGLIGRFGTKDELQLATLELAAEMFRTAVWDPTASAPAGRRRLEAVCDAWIAYLADSPFRGGCFLTTATVEFDGRPGRVRDAVRALMTRWLDALTTQITAAIEAGDLTPGTDAPALALVINALATGANCHFQLFGDPAALTAARQAMRTAISAAAAG